MSTNLDEVIGLCRECGDALGGAPPPNCIKCTEQYKYRGTHHREQDPYRKVWNTVEDEEGELLSWVRNGTLFVPTWEEIGLRCVSHSKALLKKAREQESKAAGRKLFKDAMIYRNLAEKSFEENRKIIARSR